MKETIFLNKELESLFLSGDPFEVAGEIKGKIFRKTANRITKEFSFKGNNYFIKLYKVFCPGPITFVLNKKLVKRPSAIWERQEFPVHKTSSFFIYSITILL